MHYFHNFKGFKDAQIELMRPMTLLIGRNGSGKTNVIEGVELLAQLASGRLLYEISDIGSSSNNFQIRGGLQGCARKENNRLIDFTLGVSSIDKKSITNNIDQRLFYRISISHNKLNIVDENLYLYLSNLIDKSLVLSIFDAKKNNLSGLLEVNSDIYKKTLFPLANDRSILSRYYTDIISKINPEELDSQILSIVENGTFPKIIKSVKSYLELSFVFDLHPNFIRQYDRIGASQLNKDGSNLSSVLYGIKKNDENKEPEQRLLPKLLNKLQQLPEEPFIDFEFIVVPQVNDVLLALKREDGAIIDARLLSDGTLRALAILTALETIPEGSRMVIEELDNGVHPSRVKILVDAIWECSHRRKLNVLVTTHNPATLNGLTPEQLDCVVVCHYDPVEKADKLTALPELPYADVLLQKGALGDLVTRNVLESYLMPNFEQEQQRKAQEWLDLF